MTQKETFSSNSLLAAHFFYEAKKFEIMYFVVQLLAIGCGSIWFTCMYDNYAPSELL